VYFSLLRDAFDGHVTAYIITRAVSTLWCSLNFIKKEHEKLFFSN